MAIVNDKIHATETVLKLIKNRGILNEIWDLNVNGEISTTCIDDIRDTVNSDYEIAKKLVFTYHGVEITYMADIDCIIRYGEYETSMRDFCYQFDESTDLEVEFTSALIQYGISEIVENGRITVTL